MNNKYLLTSIIHNLGIFQPKNYIKYQYSYTIDKVVENKLYLKQLVNKVNTKIKQGSSLKVGNNYLFQISKTICQDLVKKIDAFNRKCVHQMMIGGRARHQWWTTNCR